MGLPTWIRLACVTLSLCGVAAVVADERDAGDRERLIEAQRFVMQGQPARAESLIRVVIGTDSSRAEALFALNLLGKLRFREKDYPRTVEILERRLRLSPGDPEALFYLGLSYRALEEPALALPGLRRAAALEPERADSQWFLGLTLLDLRQWKEAADALERCIALDPEGPRASAAWSMLASAYRKMGRYDEAREAWRRSRVGGQTPHLVDPPLPPPADPPGPDGERSDARRGRGI